MKSVTSTPQPDSRNSVAASTTVFLAYRRQHDRNSRDLPADLPLKQREASQQTKQSNDTKDNNKADDKKEGKNNDNTLSRKLAQARPSASHPTRQVEPGSSEVAVVPVNVIPTGELPQANRQNAEKAPAETVARTQDNTAEVSAEKQTESPVSTRAKARTAEKPQPRAQAKQQPKEKKPLLGNVVTYSIQLAAGKRQISPRDPQFKGLSVERVKEGDLYKYYHGSFTNYAEAHRAMPGVLKKLPGAYMVAFLNGQKVSIKQARAAERK